jgi:hypothetical protein
MGYIHIIINPYFSSCDTMQHELRHIKEYRQSGWTDCDTWENSDPIPK